MNAEKAKALTYDDFRRSAAALKPETRMFIDGTLVDARSGDRFETINPANGQVLATVPTGTVEDVDLAVASARKAFKSGVWARLEPRARMKVLYRLVQLIDEHALGFALLDSLDVGKPVTLDNSSTWLYHSRVNHAIASALVQAAHRVESRLEEALAGVGLSIAKFETLSVLVSQDRPISLSELAAKLVCVKSNVTQLVDRLETEGLVKRANDPADRRAVRAEVTALGRKRQAAGTPVVNAVLQDVANKLSAVDSQKLKRALDAIQ